MNKVSVIIPVYKHQHSELEMIAMTNNLKVLSGYCIVFVAPNGFDQTELSRFEADNVSFEFFEKHFFEGIKGYNDLLMSSEFYERFITSEYILICQPDVFVFRDELMTWLEKGYDYIGAPWMSSNGIVGNQIFGRFNNFIRLLKGKRARHWEHLFKVGNGGFSLRKVSSHYKIATQNRADIDEYIATETGSNFRGAEDVFWSIYAPLINTEFLIPDYKEAVRFSMDRRPDIAYKLNNKQLPFACHGITRPELIVFWEPIINNYLKR